MAVPSRIVLYTLTESDADVIASRRAAWATLLLERPELAGGAGIHWGGKAIAGHAYPMIISADGGRVLNGQVFLDGNDTLYVRDVHEGRGPGAWHEDE